jgi:hypothetical protein
VNRTQKSAFLVIGLALPAAASGVATPDFRVRIGDAAPADLRLVDRSETADFVLVDDFKEPNTAANWLDPLNLRAQA